MKSINLTDEAKSKNKSSRQIRTVFVGMHVSGIYLDHCGGQNSAYAKLVEWWQRKKRTIVAVICDTYRFRNFVDLIGWRCYLNYVCITNYICIVNFISNVSRVAVVKIIKSKMRCFNFLLIDITKYLPNIK